jgi:hypothetical protein
VEEGAGVGGTPIGRGIADGQHTTPDLPCRQMPAEYAVAVGHLAVAVRGSE